jgi:hypothetical protein
MAIVMYIDSPDQGTRDYDKRPFHNARTPYGSRNYVAGGEAPYLSDDTLSRDDAITPYGFNHPDRKPKEKNITRMPVLKMNVYKTPPLAWVTGMLILAMFAIKYTDKHHR